MDKKWDVNPSKSLAGMKKPNDQADEQKSNAKTLMSAYIYIHHG